MGIKYIEDAKKRQKEPKTVMSPVIEKYGDEERCRQLVYAATLAAIEDYNKVAHGTKPKDYRTRKEIEEFLLGSLVELADLNGRLILDRTRELCGLSPLPKEVV